MQNRLVPVAAEFIPGEMRCERKTIMCNLKDRQKQEFPMLIKNLQMLNMSALRNGFLFLRASLNTAFMHFRTIFNLRRHVTLTQFLQSDLSQHTLFQHLYNYRACVGGVAQWLGSWYLAGRLSLPCARSMVHRWPLVGKLSALGQAPTQPSIPPGSANE